MAEKPESQLFGWSDAPYVVVIVVCVVGLIAGDNLTHWLLWIAGLLLLVVVVGAVVVTTSASWVAGKRVASIGGKPVAPQDSPQARSALEADPLIDQLRDLAKLHERGALTDSEFADAKGRVIASR